MHICSECGESFIRKSQLTKDERIHWGEKLHGCSTYGKAHTTKSRLTEHQNIHTREKPYIGECGKACYRKSVIIHERNERGENTRWCTKCDKAFLIRGHLILHQKTHTWKKPYTCNDCGKGFTQMSFIVHRWTRTGEKTYICSECGQGFIQKISPIWHQGVHTNKTSFLCSDWKSCPQKSGLIKYQKMHTGEKPHKWSHCGKTFIMKQQLIVH